jgi:guanylate kinase
MAIFILTAPSGAGKTSLAQSLQNQGYWDEVVSHTTRPMRNGEVEGKTYYFVSKDEFFSMELEGKFAEKVNYDGNQYGISHEEIERVEDRDKNLFIIAEYNGYTQLKDLYPDAIGIFLYMTKEDCLANMLIRGDKLDKATARISTYEEEMKNRSEYDYVIKNVRDKKDKTEGILKYIVQQNSNGFNNFSLSHYHTGGLTISKPPYFS